MTEFNDNAERGSLHDLLTDAAEDFFPGSAPYEAIVGGARRRVRLRAVAGSVLSLAAIGAAVAVGTDGFGGVAGHAPAQAVAAAAGGSPAAPVPPAMMAAAVNADHYGKTIIAQGDFDGTHWTLTRDLNRQENISIPAAPGAEKDAKPAKGPWVFDDVYVTGPNGLRDRATGGGSTAPGHLADLLKHFGDPDADVAVSATVTPLGVGAMDDSRNKEKASPYGIDILSGIVSSKVARVQVVFGAGMTRDAELVAAPADEDGRYFYLPFESTSQQVSVHIVFYDAQGHVLPSRLS